MLSFEHVLGALLKIDCKQAAISQNARLARETGCNLAVKGEYFPPQYKLHVMFHRLTHI